MVKDKKREFIVAWAQRCRMKNDIKIHCSAIFSESEDSEISFSEKKIMVPLYEKDSWFDFFSSLRSDDVITIKHTNACSIPEYKWYQFFYCFTSMEIVNKILDDKI